MLKANSARLERPGSQRLLLTIRCNSRLQAQQQQQQQCIEN
jgi:hypothetical protein